MSKINISYQYFLRSSNFMHFPRYVFYSFLIYVQVLNIEKFILLQIFLFLFFYEYAYITNYSYSLMKFQNHFKNLFKSADFFNSPQLLRYQKENQYRTVTGGFISLTIITVILAGFARMFIDTVNLSTITFTMKTQKIDEPTQTTLVTHPQNNFMIGFYLVNSQFTKINLNEINSQKKYFDIFAFFIEASINSIGSVSQVLLQPCTEQHWKIGEQSLNNFQKLQINNWLCPKIGQNISLQGKTSSQKSKILQISLSPCSNITNPLHNCASDGQLEQFFIDNGQIFYFTVFYFNTIINPDQKQYISHYLEDKVFFTFSRKLGVQAFMQFSDYFIKSDFSIWPFQDQIQEHGYFVQSVPNKLPYFIYSNQSSFLNLYFMKSDTSYSYFRQVQKISSVFSFMGGLIGALVTSLFIMNSFTNFAYEVSLAVVVFRKNLRQNEQIQKKEQQIPSPNLLQFIKFGVFSMLNRIKNENFKWQKMQKLKEYRRQIIHQLDIRSIVKRLIFLQFCVKHIFEDYQLSQLQNLIPTNPKDIQKLRQRMQCLGYVDEPSFQKSELENKVQFNQAIAIPGIEKEINVQINSQKAERQGQNIRNKINTQKVSVQQNPSLYFLQIARQVEERKQRKKEQNMFRLYTSSFKGDRVSKRILQSKSKNKIEDDSSPSFVKGKAKQNSPRLSKSDFNFLEIPVDKNNK